MRHLVNNRKIYAALAVAMLFFQHQAFPQTGPGGVGNSNGTNGQPRNIMWLDAGSLGLANGADVSAWTDMSGNGLNATQATTNNMPILATNIIGGKPVVRFRPTAPNRTQTFLQFDGSVLVNTDYSIFSVSARRSLGEHYVLGGDVSTGNQNLHWGWRDNNQFTFAQWGNDINRTLSTNTAGTFSVFSSVRRSITTPWARAIFQDGAQLGATDNNTTLLASYSGSSIGKRNTSYYDIDVAELILYTSALNEAQRLIVDNYLGVKYGINLGLNQLYSSATHVHNVVGVGTTDGMVKHTETSGSGGGILLKESGSSFDEANEFVFAGHDNTAAIEVATDLPLLPSGTLTARSQRVWYINRTEGVTTDIYMGFDLAQTGLGAGAANQIFYLLYRSGTTGAFSTLSGSQGVVVDGKVWIKVTDANLTDGYYTIARSDLTGRTWYSYNTGDWDNWQTWSLEQGGADIVNPDNLTPSTSPTSAVDKVVILHPYTVTVSTNNKQNALLEVRDGTINFGTTIGHQFDAIAGQGTIRLSADNFPSGDASLFNGTGGGTVQYNSTGFDLLTPRTFNNLVIYLTNPTDVITLRTNYTLNGYVNIQRGVLQINNNTDTEVLTLDVAQDFTVYTEGKLTVGLGNTVNGAYAIGGTMPALGQYHAIFHQLKIGGTLLNNGTVKLTNLAAPLYNQFADNGAVTLTFTGASDARMDLYSTTDLYNLIIDKGADRTFTLEVYSDDVAYFNLFGPNNVGRRTGGTYTNENPEVRKALWIKNGTLKLTGSITIPSLSEGSTSGGNGDYAIPGNGALWISGGDVKVYSTARTASTNLYPGTVGVADASSNQALSVYGEFRISDGYFSTRNSAGFIFWADASALVRLEGGVSDVAQFRSANNVAGGKTSFFMSGGTLFVRGNRTFTEGTVSVNPDGGGEKDGSYPIFGIVDPEGVFQMSGGTIYINDVTSNNSYNSNGVCILASDANHTVTGGTIHLKGNGNDNIDLIAQGNLYNVNLTRLNTTNTYRVYMGSNIDIAGDLLINGNTELYARREWGSFRGQVNDLQVARSFTVFSGGAYNHLGNTTTLLATYSNSINLYNTTQEFFNLVLKNNPSLPSTRRSLAGSSTAITVHNNLTLESGTEFQHANKDILVKGNLYNSGIISLSNPATNSGKVILSNRGIVTLITVTNGGSHTAIPTITLTGGGGTGATAIPVFDGVPSGTNALPLVAIQVVNSGSGYTSAPTVTIGSGGATATATINMQHVLGGDGSGSFGNLEVNEPHPATVSQKTTVLSANQTVSNIFTLTDGIIDLETFNLDIYTLSTHGTANEETLYSETHLVRTAGNHSDGGLTRTIFGNGTFLFPLGTYKSAISNNRYAWALQTISSFNDDGKVQINGVPAKLPTLSDDGDVNSRRYLLYYWRVRQSGFTVVPKVRNQFIGYRGDLFGQANWAQLFPGKVVNNVRSLYGVRLGGQNDDTNILDFSPEFDLETGEFTCGRSQLFVGSILIYYTRDNSRESSWNLPATWTRSDILIDANGDGTIDSKDWHDRRQPTSPNVPGIGDIAVIGWVPWDDPNVALRGQPHGVWIDNVAITVAKVQFTQMTDAAGNPVPRVYRSNFQFRPTLCINNNAGALDAGIVEGEGMFWVRIGDPSFAAMDLGDFIAQDSSYFVYENFTNNRVYNNTPDVVSNIVMANDGWGANDRNVTISKNITTLGNFEILGDLNLLLSTGATGDITVGRNLVMYEFQGSEGGASGGGAELAFQNTGTGRTVTVNGDVLLNNNGGLIRVINADNPITEHTLNVYGSITQNTANAALDGIQLFSSANTDRVTLNLLGGENETYNLVSGDTPSFYRMVVDKGSSRTTTFTFNNNFTLNGPTDGATASTKALELKNGTLVLNNAGIDITLSSGGSDFEIPSTTGLSILNGIARITTAGSNGILLDGYINIEGTDAANQGQLILDGGVGSNNYIQYSSSGNAEIRIATGKLVVSSQIRSSTLNSLGVLKYSQLSKSGSSAQSTVVVGLRSAPVNTRGIFEVYNTGSRFQIYNGSITIVRPHDNVATATRAALYIDPQSIGLNRFGTINIGDAVNNPAGGTITINSTKDLCEMVVDGNATAKLNVNSLGLIGDLDIKAGSTFDGSALDLTLYQNIINRGTVSLNVDSLLFDGTAQAIDGDIAAEKLIVSATTSLTLSGATNTVTANQRLHIETGQLIDNGHTILVKGDVTNNAAHITTGAGRIKLGGTALQRIYGTGQFGALELDNTSGARTEEDIYLNNDLYLTNGTLNINSHRFSLSENSAIIGSGFDASKMILTNGSFGDAGLTKYVPTGAFSFTFPIGSGAGLGAKFTPAELVVSANSTAGSITIHPVNQAHMTTIGPNVLQYYWTITSSGLSNFSGNMHLHYYNADVVGDEALYISARLQGDSWSKYPVETVVEADDRIELDYIGVSDLSGDYTAGYDTDIPANIPIYISNGTGNWSDVTKWIRLDGNPVPAGGPQGHIVQIREGDVITMDRFRILSYRTQIFGRLEVGTQIGHNLGYVSGTGTLAFVNEKVFPGEYTDFLTCGTGGTVEFGGGSYDIPLFNSFSQVDDQFNNLVISGTGIKVFPDRDNIRICNNLSVIETATLKLEHFSRPNGTFKYTTIGGDIYVGSSAFLDTDYGEYVNLAGDFTIEPGGKLGASYVYQNFDFIGTIDQSISGNYTGTNQFNIIINRNPNFIYCNGPIDILSFIYPITGTMVTTDVNILTIKRNSGNGLRYPSTYTGIVDGPLKNNILTTTSYTVYPYLYLGNNGEKKFITLTSTPTTVNYWTGEFIRSNPLSAGMDPNTKTAPLQTVSNVEYWELNGSATATVNARFTLPITASNDICQGVTNVSNLRIAMWNGSSWVQVPSAPTGGSTKSSGTIETTSDFTFSPGVTYYLTIASTEVITIPTAQFTNGNQTICEGDAVTMEITLTGNGPWDVNYSDGVANYTLTDITSPYTFNITPTATRTYTITSVTDNIGTTGNVIGSNPVITVIPTPTPYNVAGTTTICGVQTATISLSGSQVGYTYELYRNGAPTGNTKIGTNSALSFTGISLAGTYTIYAYKTGSPLCNQPMIGSAIITTSTGATATITGLATGAQICNGDAVQVNILLVGVPPFSFTVNESYSGRTFNINNLNVASGTTYTYTITPSPAWQDQGNPTPYIATYTYTITNVSDNSGCGVGSCSGSASVDVYKLPETGPQYHISNNFGY